MWVFLFRKKMHMKKFSILKKTIKNQPKRFYPDYQSSVLRSPKLDLVEFVATNTEMTGPLFDKGIIGKLDNDLTINFSKNGSKAIGQEIFVHGYIKDQNGKPLKNVMIEIWQANAGGKYRHLNDNTNVKLDDNFSGCGRFLTSSDGYYYFKTIQPGAYPFPNNGIKWRPMHIHFSLFGRSFVQRLITQMYFEGDPLISLCSIINAIPDKKSRNHLIAKLDLSKSETEKILGYKFDIILRGKDQTFFENKLEGL